MNKIPVIALILVFLVAAGYFLTKNKPILVDQNQTPTPTIVEENVEEEIQSLLAKKYYKSANDVTVTITKQDGNFVSGGVKFTSDGSGAGGALLARKVNDKWELVFDGNGGVDCNELRQKYGFPDTILKPNFCD